MASALLVKARFALTALILVTIALWFWGRGIWPHELDVRRTGELLLQVSTSVFATAGLLRLANSLLGEDVWETEPQFINQRYGQVLFPEEFPRGLKSFVTLVVVGAALGFFVAWLCEATYASRATLPTSDTTLIARSGDIAFDLYALVLVWLFATSLPHLLFSLGQICVSVAGELSDHVLGDRFPVIRVLRASRILSATTSHDQKVAAIAVLAAIPEPLAEKTLVDALERIDDGRIHAVISTTLKKRGWIPSTPLQWKRVALSAPTGDRACIQALVDLLRDPDPRNHQQASRLLDSFGWSPATSEELVWFLLARSQGEPDYMSIAREGEAAITALMEIVDNRFPGRPAEARRALLSIPSDKVTQILLRRVAADKSDNEYRMLVAECCNTRSAHTSALLMKLLATDPSTTTVPCPHPLSRKPSSFLVLRFFAVLCGSCTILAAAYAIDRGSLLNAVTTLSRERAAQAGWTEIEGPGVKPALSRTEQIERFLDRQELWYRRNVLPVWSSIWQDRDVVRLGGAWLSTILATFLLARALRRGVFDWTVFALFAPFIAPIILATRHRAEEQQNSWILDRLVIQRWAFLRALAATRRVRSGNDRKTQLAALATLAAERGPYSQRCMVALLESSDMSALYPNLVSALQSRGWVPSSPLQWQRVALISPSANPGCIQALVEMLRNPDQKIHQVAAGALEQLGWMSESKYETAVFLRALSHGLDYTRMLKAGEAAIEPLLEIVDGKFPGSPNAALDSIISAGHPRAINAILERITPAYDLARHQTVIRGLANCRATLAADLLGKLLNRGSKTSRALAVQAGLLAALEQQAGQSPTSRNIISQALGKGLRENPSDLFACQFGDLLRRLDPDASRIAFTDAVQRKEPWTAPGLAQIRNVSHKIQIILQGSNFASCQAAAEELRTVLPQYAAWMPPNELRKLAQTQIRLTHTYIEKVYYQYDVCNNPIGKGYDETRTSEVDLAPLKQIARQELIRRGEQS